MHLFYIANSQTKYTEESVKDITTIPDGQVAILSGKFITEDNGYSSLVELENDAFIDHCIGDGVDPKRMQIVIGATDKEGVKRPVVIPFYNNHLSYTVTNYRAGVAKEVIVDLHAPVSVGEHSIIIAKKGVPFNERNKYTFSYYVKDSNVTLKKLFDELTKAINKCTDSTGFTSYENETADDYIAMGISSLDPSVDFEVLLADELMNNGSTVATGTEFVSAIGDKKMIMDLYNKHIADRGINDTYLDGAAVLYPNYPADRGSASYAEKYDILNLRFAVPRNVKTRDEVVHQIVQIAFPRNNNNRNAQLVSLIDVLNSMIKGHL